MEGDSGFLSESGDTSKEKVRFEINLTTIV